MIMNSTKIMFLSLLILSTLVTLSSTNWMGMWMGLEMNLMTFIPLISKSKNKNSSQAMMMYFLTQSIGSITMLFSVVMNPLIFVSPNLIEELNKMLIIAGGLIKLGAAPFHFWLPELVANLTWVECMILLTWQKVAPMFLVYSVVPTNNWMFYSSIALCTITGAVGGLNQTSLRKIVAYSSISHMGWMMMLIAMSGSWYKYLMIYSILVVMLCMTLKSMNALFINQLNSCSPSLAQKMTITSLMMSMGGLPPFLGFLPKWMVIQMMINSELYGLMLLMMLTSLITLFYYLRMMVPFILNYSSMNKWMIKKTFESPLMMLTLFTNSMLPLVLIYSFF
nr:NADH-ubiquinone oxidoreductase chain 2 [Discogaster dentipes]